MKVLFNVYDGEEENEYIIKAFEMSTDMLIMEFENNTTANYILGEVDEMKVLRSDDITLNIIAVSITIKGVIINLFQVNRIKYDYDNDIRILCQNGDEF